MLFINNASVHKRKIQKITKFDNKSLTINRICLVKFTIRVVDCKNSPS